MKPTLVRISMRSALFTLLIIFAGQAVAQPLFFDDFDDRVRDQFLIGNGWVAFDQFWNGDACSGTPDGTFFAGEAENRNFWTAGQQGDSYFRAGLEVPAWDGVLSNMMRVYGNQYFPGGTGCERVLVFQDYPNIKPGDYTFSFDVAQDRYGFPENGEVIGAFVQVLNSSFERLYFETLITDPPSADPNNPDSVRTRKQSIEFTIPEDWDGELLQFGFFNDVKEPLGQSWARAGAYYDNVTLEAENSGETRYTVRTDWFVQEEIEAIIDFEVEVTLSCDTPITDFVISNGTDPVSQSEREIVVILEDGDFVTATVQVINEGTSQCQATQVPRQEFTETDASEECAGVELEEGDSATCTFEYTTFFEGIPAIGAYGKALMILLLLGVGFVAVRRFA